MPYADRKRQNQYQSERLKARRRQWVKENGPCRKCGSRRQLQVDHIDPKTKFTHRIWSYCESRRRAELAKCQVLCKSCHRQKSNEELIKPLVHGASAYKSSKCRCSVCTKAAIDSAMAWKATHRQPGSGA